MPFPMPRIACRRKTRGRLAAALARQGAGIPAGAREAPKAGLI